MKKVKEKGFNTYRHKQNPKEKELHDCFVEKFSERDMDYLVFGHSKSPSGERPNDYLTNHERKIVISTVQWIVSPVGQGLLQDCGFGELKTYKTREKLSSRKIACLEKQLAKIPLWVKSIFK